MGDRDDRAGIILQMMFEPGHRFGVEMVGRLVEQQNVGLLQQQAAQGHTAALAAGENFHRRLRRRAAQRIHRHLQPRVQIPGVEMIELLLHLALAFEQLVHVVVGHFLGELGVDLFKFFEQVDGLLHRFFDHLAHRARVVDQRLLLQISRRYSPARARLRR